MGVTLDTGPLLFSSDEDYLIMFAAVVQKAAETRAVLEKSLAARIAIACGYAEER